MTSLRRCIPVLAALLLTACDNPRDDITRRLRKASVTALLTDSARLHTQFFAAPSQDYVPLHPYQWPESARQLDPLRISLYRNGLALALRDEPGFEFGLHIVPHGLNEPPAPTPYVHYERIEKGIYHYTLQR